MVGPWRCVYRWRRADWCRGRLEMTPLVIVSVLLVAVLMIALGAYVASVRKASLQAVSDLSRSVTAAIEAEAQKSKDEAAARAREEQAKIPDESHRASLAMLLRACDHTDPLVAAVCAARSNPDRRCHISRCGDRGRHEARPRQGSLRAASDRTPGRERDRALERIRGGQAR